MYGIVCFTCTIQAVLTSTYKKVYVVHVKHTLTYLYINRLPEDEPSVSKHVEDIKS